MGALRIVCLLGLAAILAVTVAPLAQAQMAEEFYRRKSIDFIIGYPPGAGFDLYGRALSQHMGAHIPGNPTIVPRNMPGASSLKGLQFIAGGAPKDGSVIGIFNALLLIQGTVDPPSVNVDFDKLSWIGNMSSDTKVCFSMRSVGVTQLDDLRTKKLIVGGTARGGVNAYGAILRAIYGDNIKMVLGYPSNADVWLAMEKGEVDANCTGYGVLPAKKPEWIKGGTIVVLSQFARNPKGDLKSVPRIFDVKGLSAQMQAAIAFIAQADAIVRPIVAPPDIPGDRLRVLQDAFMKTMADKEFVAFAQKATLELDPMDAATVKATVAEIVNTPPDAVELARKLLE